MIFEIICQKVSIKALFSQYHPSQQLDLLGSFFLEMLDMNPLIIKSMCIPDCQMTEKLEWGSIEFAEEHAKCPQSKCLYGVDDDCCVCGVRNYVHVPQNF